MPQRRKSVAPQTKEQVLMDAIHALNARVKQISQPVMSGLQTIAINKFPNPNQGDTAINWPWAGVWFYHKFRWRPIGGGKFVIVIYPTDTAIVAGDPHIMLDIPQDLDDAELIFVGASVYTPGGSAVQVQVVNHTQADAVMTTITVDAGEKDSKDSGSQPVIDPAHKDVAWGDQLIFPVTATGAATGLNVWLIFS